METLLNKFNQEYQFLYDNKDNVCGYREAVEAFDYDMQTSEEFKKLVQDFVKYRNDMISSDREAGAFEFACESLGIREKLGLY